MSSQSRIVVFCGKGGVGKTTLCLATGLRHAARGRKVVIVSSHPLNELAVAVSLDGLAAHSPVAAKNLFIVHLDPKVLLAEVVEENFPVQWVARKVLNSAIYQNLMEVAPGLKEFYFLARLQRLAERKTAVPGAEDALNYDLLLWDAPATGHFLSTLRAARSFEVYLTGPLASAGAELHRFFSNTDRISVLPVTTLEEMAVQETVEMCRTLDRDFRLPPSALLLNMVSPLAAAPQEQVAALPEGSEAMRFARDRGAIEREQAAALREAVAAREVLIPRVRNGGSDLKLLDQIGGSLEEIGLGAAA